METELPAEEPATPEVPDGEDAAMTPQVEPPAEDEEQPAEAPSDTEQTAS